jgi:RNA polymerase sigma-70 factor (ECF subfamily)
VNEKHYTDQHLIERSCAGDMQAFEALVQRYERPLSAFVRSCLGSSEATSDVMQRIWLQLYRSLPTLQTQTYRSSLRAWLYQVTRNKCIDEIRRRKRDAVSFSELEAFFDEEVSPILLLPDPDPLPETCWEQREMLQEVIEGLSQLPPKWRNIMWLRYRMDLTFEEIGSRLDMPPSTAKTYYHRGCLRLRALLSSAGNRPTREDVPTCGNVGVSQA